MCTVTSCHYCTSPFLWSKWEGTSAFSVFIALHWSKPAYGYLQLSADYFTKTKEYKEKQQNSSRPEGRLRLCDWTWQVPCQAPLCCPCSEAAVSISWVHFECTRASELYSCFMWQHNPSNFLGITRCNPHPGDIHPCPEGSSGDHTPCCHAFVLKPALRNQVLVTLLAHATWDFPHVSPWCWSFPYTTSPLFKFKHKTILMPLK